MYSVLCTAYCSLLELDTVLDSGHWWCLLARPEEPHVVSGVQVSVPVWEENIYLSLSVFSSSFLSSPAPESSAQPGVARRAGTAGRGETGQATVTSLTAHSETDTESRVRGETQTGGEM